MWDTKVISGTVIESLERRQCLSSLFAVQFGAIHQVGETQIKLLSTNGSPAKVQVVQASTWRNAVAIAARGLTVRLSPDSAAEPLLKAGQLNSSISGVKSESEDLQGRVVFSDRTINIEATPSRHDPDRGEAYVPLTVKRVTPVLRDVMFSAVKDRDFYAVAADDGTVFPGPHWKSKRGVQTPIAAKQQARLEIAKAHIDLLGMPSGYSASKAMMIRADGPGQYDFSGQCGVDNPKDPADQLRVDGSVATFSGQAAAPFRKTIEHFNPFVLKWSISFDRGKTWVSLGSTRNPLYTLNTAPENKILYNNVAFIASHAAAGKQGAIAIIDAIWREFADREVRRADGRLMRYGHPGSINVYKMLTSKSATAQCIAWADLLVMVFRAHGLDATSWRVYPGDEYDRIGVKDIPAQGSKGQNYATTDFIMHQVVRVGLFPRRVYDPSYGIMIEVAAGKDWRIAYENRAVARYRYKDLGYPRDVWWIKNDQAVRELRFEVGSAVDQFA